MLWLFSFRPLHASRWAAHWHVCFRSIHVAAWGANSGRGLENQVGDFQEMMFDVRWGSLAPRAAVGRARAAQVANRPTADPLTACLF